MISALNMELEIVRTVFSNEVCEASVYTDMRGGLGSHYTIVSIFSRETAKDITARMAISSLFVNNRDFIGSFTHRSALCLVFLYRPEIRLANREAIYAGTFVKRKEIAISFLTALAETEMQGDIGKLLITEENINISGDGVIYLNYFLNFQNFSPHCDPEDFLRDASQYVFRILTGEFEARFERQIDYYPYELRLMQKKVENRSFKSLSQIIMFVRSLSNIQKPRRLGFLHVVDKAEEVKNKVSANPTKIFLSIVVTITIVYLGYQIGSRIIADRHTQENTMYVGLQTIGDVYLGEEYV